MINILTIDVEDYFHVSAFEQIIKREEWDRFESRVEDNTCRILDLLSKKGVSATFFVLGWVAERFPSLVRDIHEAGHEVACHGYSHRLVYSQTPQEFREETRLSKRILEDACGCSVLSYRAASYSITGQSAWALEILAEEGFRFDSSVFPVVHDRYGIPRAMRGPVRIELDSGLTLVECPLSTLSFLDWRLPIAGGGYFRLFPYPLLRMAVRRLNHRDRLPLIFYLHPWELDPHQPRIQATGLSRFRHYFNLHKTASRFDTILGDFEFGPLAAAMGSFPLTAVNLREFLGQSTDGNRL